MYIAVPPLLHSVAVNSKLYPYYNSVERSLVSLTPKISNVKLCSEIRVVSSSMWKESEEIFKWKKDRQFFELFNKDESSQGLQYLLETVSEEGSSIASLSWSMRSWLNFGSLVCFKEFLIGDGIYGMYGIYHIVLQDGYSQLLLQILHGNLVTTVNCWKSRLAVYSTVGKEY